MNFLKYNPHDIDKISQLFIKTFTDSAGESEGILLGDLVQNLIKDTDIKDLYGFVATDDTTIIGSIFFSRMTFNNGESAFLLSPVAIHTAFQKKGIGQKLINFGIDCLKKNKISLLITYGDPAFYSKIGFKKIAEKTIKPPFKLSQPEGWLGLSLTDEDIKPIAAVSSCVSAFDIPELW